MKYSKILRLNNKLEGTMKLPEFKIAILSNIMVHQSKDICEYILRLEGINANVILGEYDNIVQDSEKLHDISAVIVFWELSNFIDGFQYKYNNLSKNNFDNLEKKIKLEIDLVFENLNKIPLVLVNRFSSLVFNQFNLSSNKLNKLESILNSYVEARLDNNVRIIDHDKVISKLSISSSVDLRYYYSSKTLYSIEFYKEYFDYIKPIFLSASGKIKKALILDCDNTLWRGIIGEDGLEHIKIYKEFQYLLLDLSNQGVIIGLCSKNNLKDVDKVISSHPDMILQEENIVIKKVNWENKVSNLQSISNELNIGLDSLVFIDDSNFEIELIKSSLPEVKCYKVPSREFEIGLMMRELSNLFYNPSITDEDIQKTRLYKDQIKRAKNKSVSIEDYLKSLNLTIYVYFDDFNQVPRISQLTQKTNQFNLTSKRYTEKEIEEFIIENNKTVISIKVHDKFGDCGLTGLSILDNDELMIDTLLLSCRILGRGIENRFMDIIVDFFKSNGNTVLGSRFIPTNKNQQTEDFYNSVGFVKSEENIDFSEYHLTLENYKSSNSNYIKVQNGR
jgi:FkbH-like protein